MRLGLIMSALDNADQDQAFVRALSRYLGEGVTITRLDTSALISRTPHAIATPAVRAFLKAADDVEGLIIIPRVPHGTIGEQGAQQAVAWLGGQAGVRGLAAAVASVGDTPRAGGTARHDIVLSVRQSLADMGVIAMPRPDAHFEIGPGAFSDRSVVLDPALEEALTEFSAQARAFFSRRSRPRTGEVPALGTGADTPESRRKASSRGPAASAPPVGSLSTMPTLIANPKRSRA